MDYYRANKMAHGKTVVEDEAELSDIEEDTAEFIPSEMLETEETRQYITDLVSKLPDEQKTAVLLHYYQQISIPDIAEMLKCSEGTIKSRLYYARRFIKADIEKKQKKGYKVIAVVPVPLLTQILLKQAEQTKLTPSTSENIWNSIERSLDLPATGVEIAAKSTAQGVKIAGITVPVKVAAIVIGILSVSMIAVWIASSQPTDNEVVTPIVNSMTENSQADNSEGEEATSSDNLASNNLSSLGVIELKTKSDYAMMYYDMIQKVYINDEGFLDAEIAQNSDGTYSLEMIYEEGGDYNFYYATVADDNYDFSTEPEKILYEYTDTHYKNFLKWGSVLESAMIVNDNYGREALLRILNQGFPDSTYRYVYVAWRRKDSFTFCASYENKDVDENGYVTHNPDPYVFTLFGYRGSTQEYAEEIVLEDLKANCISTWGVGHGETDFTRGERLKDYFK